MAAAASRRRGAAADEEGPARRQGEAPMVIYCKRCDREFVREPDEFGVTCRWCRRPVRPPWVRRKPSSPTTKAPPPPRPKPEMFPCPGQCPRCGAQFASMVCAGKWHLRCKTCSKYTMVDVQGPDMATCSRWCCIIRYSGCFRIADISHSSTFFQGSLQICKLEGRFIAILCCWYTNLILYMNNLLQIYKYIDK